MPRNNPYANVPEAPPELDLTTYGEAREIELEIGFGRGHFLLERAARRPEARLLGLEVRRKWVALTADRAKKQGLRNVDVYFGDARALLPSWTPEASVTAIFVNFPDPWWKKRHHKRRVLAPDMVDQFVRLLRPGGILLAQTDVADRAADYENLLSNHPGLQPAGGQASGVVSHNPVDARSLREKRCTEAGLPIFRLFFEKI